MPRPLFSLFFCLLPAFLFSQKWEKKNPLHQILRQNPEFETVISQIEVFEPQVIFTQIDRDENGLPHFKTWTWNCDSSRYFYPASTVKLPTALVALDWLNRQNQPGLTANSPLFHGAGHAPQTAVEADSSATNGLPSVANYVKKILLVSDNEAQNRLYELLGQEYLNEILWQKGWPRTRIWHRLDAPNFNPEANRWTNPVHFERRDSIQFRRPDRSIADSVLRIKIWERHEVFSRIKPDFQLKNEQKGIGFYRNDSLINQPFDFSKRNFIALEHLDGILKSVIFPEMMPEKQRFNLTADDYRLLRRTMSMFPRESKSPRYAEPDGYCKFFILGGGSTEHAPPGLRIFNKVGDAYGFLLDVSYVVDFESKTEFFLTAVLNCNSDGIFNDDKYDYETIGFPFFKALGERVLEFEQQRKKPFLPDLSPFKFDDYRN